jgi:tripeptidyl-peptidase-1
LIDVSDPSSPNYGKHKSLEEIATVVHADPESVAAVNNILKTKTGKSPSFTIGGGFAVINLPVSTVETLFGTKFYKFQHVAYTNVTTTRSLDYNIPNELKDHLDFVCCLNKFPYPDQVSLLKSYNSPFPLSVSPSSITKTYNISDYANTNSNNSQGVAGFLKQYFKPSDLEDFQSEFKVPKNPIVKVIGENKADSPGAEASLDVEYITGVGRNVPTWFISVSTYSNGKQEDFLSWLTILSNTSDSPWVHSVSYGDYENTIDSAYMTRCEDEFKKLGISGRSLLFASGDSGVNCKGGKFHPNWPTSSPSVTSIGGTESLEKVWASGGGGFSNVFTMPDYQKETVMNYLQKKKHPKTSYFNPQGRAYPDISAYAMGFLIYVDSIPMTVGGTSCSAPTTAGVISLLNDVRLNNGMSTLGFMNPLLYKLQGEGFFDITQGENYGDNIFCDGFKAVNGWDPASGWGSPNFGILKNLVIKQ